MVQERSREMGFSDTTPTPSPSSRFWYELYVKTEEELEQAGSGDEVNIIKPSWSKWGLQIIALVMVLKMVWRSHPHEEQAGPQEVITPPPGTT